MLRLESFPEEVRIVTGRYPSGNTAVRLVTADNEPVATLSVDAGIALPDGEFVLKNYSENAAIAAELLAARVIEDTRGRVLVGLAGLLPICRLR